MSQRRASLPCTPTNEEKIFKAASTATGHEEDELGVVRARNAAKGDDPDWLR